MTTRVRRVVTAIDAAGKAFSEVHTETQVGERWLSNDPTSLAEAGPEAEAWREHFNASVAQELSDLIKVQKETAAQLTEVTGQRDSLLHIADRVPEWETTVTALAAERDALTTEVARLTALVPPPVEAHMITRATFVDRLEAASPGVIDRLWASDTKEAGQLAVTLFTWSDRIDCRPGGRLEGYLNLIVQMGFMDADSVAKVLV